LFLSGGFPALGLRPSSSSLAIPHWRPRTLPAGRPVHAPPLVAIVNVDDVALLGVFGAVFVRQFAEIVEWRVAGQIAGVPKQREAACAFGVAHPQIGLAAQRGDGLLEQRLGFGGALLRHQRLGCLRAPQENRGQHEQQHGCSSRSEQQNDGEKTALSYPHSTAPPFTLRTSPLIKVARSEARKRMGPATSSAVATLPSGIAAVANFHPALVFSR